MFNNFSYIRRKILFFADVLECLIHEVGQSRFVAAPVFQSTGKTRSNLRVELVHEKYAVHPELIAHTVRTMEFGTAGPEEGTEQGVDAVGVVILILRMLGQRTNEIPRRTFSR